VRRRLAGMPENVVNTPCLTEAVDVAYSVARNCTIGLFDGPVGTGKTTAARWAMDAMQTPFSYVIIPSRRRPLAGLKAICKSLTGEQQSGDTEALENIALEYLTGWGGLLVVDEAASLGTSGMAQFQYLHDASEESFGLLFVGHGTQQRIRPNATLDDRIVDRAMFYRLDGQELLAVLRDMDPRLANTPKAVLARLDNRLCDGVLRSWSKVLLHLDERHPAAEKITPEIAEDLLVRLTGSRRAAHDKAAS
jgi:hypothetical protein